MLATELFNETSIEKLKSEISKSFKNEVFFLGKTDSNKKIIEVKTIARGNSFSVPAILRDLETGDVVIHNHPSGQLSPSDADINICSYLGNFGVASVIINNKVTECYIVVEIFSKVEIEKLDKEKIINFYNKDGIINQKISDYEYREQQLQMVDKVVEAFNENKISAIEASTGTGKTMAYLIPAILWSLQNKEKCVVATNTINLQEQIVKKDLPLISKILPLDFSYVLLKGKNNYICLNKLYKAYQNPELLDIEKNDELEKLFKWVKITSDGSKSDLNFNPNFTVWESVCAEVDNCLHTKCPYFKNCFINKVRREANNANIIVVNHHLLISDIILKYQQNNFNFFGVLPSYSRIIFDEAHNVEAVASKHLGITINPINIIRTLNKIHFKIKGSEKGKLPYIRNKIIHSKIQNKDKEQIIIFLNNQIMNEIEILKSDINANFNIILDYFENSLKVDRNNKLRITNEIEQTNAYFNNIAAPLIEIIKKIGNLLADITLFIRKVNIFLETDEHLNEVIHETNFISNKLNNIISNINFYLKPDNPDNIVKWLEIKKYKKKEIATLNSVPIDISELFFHSVILPNKTIIFTSATISINNNFNFFNEMLGLNYCKKTDLKELVLESPFNLKKQTAMFIPTDFPEPNNSQFEDLSGKLIFEILRKTKGKAFILFTSYKQMQNIYTKLSNALELYNINSFIQGEMPRQKLLKYFKKDINSVLFATNSFWEGVDVKGESLQCVILVKLPFQVPDDPLLEAKAEKLQKEGKNSFIHYSLPMAVLKFKQGIGRLIRTKTDKGVLIILDKRIKTKSYGKQFTNSIKNINISYNTQQKITDEINIFFN